MFAYIATKLITRILFHAQQATSTQTGTGVYTGDLEGPIEITIDCPVTNQGTFTFTIDSSTDNSTWTTNVTTLLVDPTTGASASFAQVTTAVALSGKTLAIPKTVCPPYVRLVATAASSPTTQFAAWLNGISKFN